MIKVARCSNLFMWLNSGKTKPIQTLISEAEQGKASTQRELGAYQYEHHKHPNSAHHLQPILRFLQREERIVYSF